MLPKEQMPHKHNVEAVLFSTGRKMTVEEIAKLCKILKDDAVKALKELQVEYDARNSSLMIVDEGDSWKLTTRERHQSIVKKIVSETELPKSVVETLAVIAWKAPVLQSDIIKVRTNKAYDHLKELEQSGYITRQKKSRTNLIKLTQKFFQYFDLPPEKLQQMFKNITEMEQAILEKEKQLEAAKQEHTVQEEELKKQQEMAKKMSETQVIDDVEVDLIAKGGENVKLETYAEQSKEEKPDSPRLKLGELEVVDDEEAEELEDHEAEPTEAHLSAQEPIKENVQNQIEEPENEEPELEESKEHEVPEQIKPQVSENPAQDNVDKRVQELLHPKKEEDVSETKAADERGQKKGVPKDLLEASQEEQQEDLEDEKSDGDEEA